MGAVNPVSARRAWLEPELRAEALHVAEPPTLGRIFKSGFLRGSMLQLAVCAPPRQAAMRKYEAVYVTSLGAAAHPPRPAPKIVEAEQPQADYSSSR